MRIWAFETSPTVLYSCGVPNWEQRLSQAVQTVRWFVFLLKLWLLLMQSMGTLELQTQFHMTVKDPKDQCGEKNIQHFKPVSHQRIEKAKQGAVLCIKGPFSNQIEVILKSVLDLSILQRCTDKCMSFLHSLCHGFVLFSAPKVCEQTQILSPSGLWWKASF